MRGPLRLRPRLPAGTGPGERGASCYDSHRPAHRRPLPERAHPRLLRPGRPGVVRSGPGPRPGRTRPPLPAGDRRRAAGGRRYDRLHQPGPPGRSGRGDRRRHPRAGLAGARRRDRGLPDLEEDERPGASRLPVPGRRAGPRDARRLERPDGGRGRQVVDRGRRGHRRGDRLPRVLRPRGAPAGPAAPAGPDRGREQLPRLPAAGRGGGDPALELRLRDHGRDVGCRLRHRQHGLPQALARRRGDRGQVRRPDARAGPAAGRPQLRPGRPAGRGRGAGDRPAHPLRLVHRLQERRAADQRAGRQDPARPALDQARGGRDGRQGCDRRRRRRRPRRRGCRRRRLRLRLHRAEVLGVLARDRRRPRLRPLPREADPRPPGPSPSATPRCTAPTWGR